MWQAELEATRTEIQKWQTAFQDGPATPAGATPGDLVFSCFYICSVFIFNADFTSLMIVFKKYYVDFCCMCILFPLLSFDFLITEVAALQTLG